MQPSKPLPEIIDGKTARGLAESRDVRGAVILGQPGGWTVLIRCGAGECAIAAQRARKPRLWRNLNNAVAYVRKELGLSRFEVDTLAHDPGAVERKRPDQVERLRRQHEAAAHDAWFRAEVQKTLDGIETGEARWIEHDDVLRGLDARIARLKARGA